MLWARTALFALVMPGTVLVLVRGGLIALDVGPRLGVGPGRWVGLPHIILGVAVIATCFGEFIRRGRGTPAPYDPPRQLIASGLYRHVRNPQYLGVFLITTGEDFVSDSAALLGYAALLVVA